MSAPVSSVCSCRRVSGHACSRATPANSPADLQPLAEAAQGDLLDPSYVAGALRGVDALFWACPSRSPRPIRRPAW
ncbi:MAG: hypothetical protein SYR96_26520 [Actinomycetota bacterium]|nr:hypothetical protein [Actinomycetota bacterium]